MRSLGRKWFEVIVKWLPGAGVEVVIPFRFEYHPYKPRRVLAIDLNLKTLTLYDGERVRRIRTRYPEALRLKHLAENVQRKHPYSWRRSKRLLKLVSSLHHRSSMVVLDWSRKTAKYIVSKAKKIGAIVAIEELKRLWYNTSQKSSTLADKLSRFAYRKLLQALEAKAVEYNVPIILVDPRNTSKTCPKCRRQLRYHHRLALCPSCGYKADRDTVGAKNIWLRAVRVPSPGSGGTHPDDQ